ncbi:MAG: DUF1284 domain-containing protein [Blautia sp.]|nr:DUF1284 domain-containing protein [Blautia sp.]
MKLRPHHFMCIQMFTGHGYNAEFTSHMEQKIKMLSDETTILVQEGCDEICEKCPNREQNTCRDFAKVRRLDDDVKDACGISYSDKIMWNDIASAVREQILDTELFGEICCECEWYSLCRETLAKVDL